MSSYLSRIAALAALVVVPFACGGDDASVSPLPDSGGNPSDSSSSDHWSPGTDSSMPDSSQGQDGSTDDGSTSDADVDSSSPPDSSTDAGSGCTSNSDCTLKQYCDKGVGNCSGTGKCLATPMVCPLIYMPVCGCDKKTYNNSCEAHRARVNEDYKGVCE